MIFDDLRNDVCLSNCSCHELRDNHIFDVNLNRVIISHNAWFTVAMAFRILMSFTVFISYYRFRNPIRYASLVSSFEIKIAQTLSSELVTLRKPAQHS